MNTQHTQAMHARSPVASALAALLIACMSLIVLPGCEDSPPDAYSPMPFVEAYLYVDRPITDVRVMMTQPLTQPFSYQNGMIPDADVRVDLDGKSILLTYKIVNGVGTYTAADTNLLVLPETRYTLHVRLKDGTVMTGATVTPPRITWVSPPMPVLQYPKDTVNLPSPDSLRIAWSPVNVTEYLLRAECLDTLRYGAYLTPPTSEINGRTNNLGRFETPESPTFYSTTRWGLLQTTRINVVWTAFRWYGMHTIAVFAPDKNMLDWFKATRFNRSSEYQSQFGSITGGLGVFGSASYVEAPLFLLKR